ncbi:MAG: serine hydrolase domain-containing protein [bacterium]
MPGLKRTISFFFCVFFASAAHATENADSTLSHFKRTAKAFEIFVHEAVDAGRVPGAAIAIVNPNYGAFVKGLGVRTIGHPEPIDTHTVFRIASVSKGFAAVLTGILVEEGRLNWNDRVLRYLPDFSLTDSCNTQKSMIRHILSHTTGVQEHAFTTLLDGNVSYKKIVKELDRASIVCEVGECFAYQNVVYSLIGDILKAATGQSYEWLLADRIFEPLGMRDASVGWQAIKSQKNRATPHVRASHRWIPTRIRKTYYSVPPAAGVNASIADMARWLTALLGGFPQIISIRTLIDISEQVIITSKGKRYYRIWKNLRKAWYGLGWRVLDYAGTKVVYHGGYVRGYRAEIAFVPEYHVGVVILMNAGSRFANICVPTFLDLYLQL